MEETWREIQRGRKGERFPFILVFRSIDRGGGGRQRDRETERQRDRDRDRDREACASSSDGRPAKPAARLGPESRSGNWGALCRLRLARETGPADRRSRPVRAAARVITAGPLGSVLGRLPPGPSVRSTHSEPLHRHKATENPSQQGLCADRGRDPRPSRAAGAASQPAALSQHPSLGPWPQTARPFSEARSDL